MIGQACEFDYSGTQACRVLREEGLRVILVNSNPATIMTDPEFADATYIEPITPEFVETSSPRSGRTRCWPRWAARPRSTPRSRCTSTGVLEKYGVELIGADIEAIQRARTGRCSRRSCDAIGADVARSRWSRTRSTSASRWRPELGYPLVVRPSFTMGGAGSGFAHDEAELRR